MSKENKPPVTDEPTFTGINHLVCCYCLHLVVAEASTNDIMGCNLTRDRLGRYARLTPSAEQVEKLNAKGRAAVNSLEGCIQFDSSGLPVHPNVRQKLTDQNELAMTIPVDINAVETSGEFAVKRSRFAKSIPVDVIIGGKVVNTIQ